jgi:hypothetical protein
MELLKFIPTWSKATIKPSGIQTYYENRPVSSIIKQNRKKRNDFGSWRIARKSADQLYPFEIREQAKRNSARDPTEDWQFVRTTKTELVDEGMATPSTRPRKSRRA